MILFEHTNWYEIVFRVSLQTVPASAIPDGWMGLDIGPDSIKTFNDALETTKTVIWNGPMGVFEFDKFALGTEVCLNFRFQNGFYLFNCLQHMHVSAFFTCT